METVQEKFTIDVTDSGIVIKDARGQQIIFTAGEALMLLDILRSEEAELNRMAEEASPLPIKIHF